MNQSSSPFPHYFCLKWWPKNKRDHSFCTTIPVSQLGCEIERRMRLCKGEGGDPRSGWGRRTSVKYTCIKRSSLIWASGFVNDDISVYNSPRQFPEWLCLPSRPHIEEERSKKGSMYKQRQRTLSSRRTRRNWAKTMTRRIFIFMKLKSTLVQRGPLGHHEKLHFAQISQNHGLVLSIFAKFQLFHFEEK